MLFASVLMNGLFYQAFAGSGNASDGLIGILVIIGFLLIVAGILYLTDYLHHNGKRLIQSLCGELKTIIKSAISLIKKSILKYLDLAFLS